MFMIVVMKPTTILRTIMVTIMIKTMITISGDITIIIFFLTWVFALTFSVGPDCLLFQGE